MTASLLCLDLETNGLNINKHRVIEIACCLTDISFGAEQDPPYFHSLVHPTYPGLAEVGRIVDRAIEDANEYVTEMHESNGLWQDLRAAKDVATTQVDARLAEWLTKTLEERDLPLRPLLCGASIHFDRKFFEREFPKTLELCHHRNFDVSTIKRLYDWYFDCATIPEPPEENTHRALPDIQWSLHEARVLVADLRKNYGYRP